MRTCSVPNCDRKYKAKGYCQTHYKRLQNGEDMDAPIREYEYGGTKPRRVETWCTHPGCDREHEAKGFCNMHYQRLKNGKDMDAPAQVYGIKTCSVTDCDRKHVAKGYCKTHYERHLKGQDMDAPIRQGRALSPREFLISAVG